MTDTGFTNDGAAGGPVAAPRPRDVDVVAYCQDADSSGWRVLALIRFQERSPGGAWPGGVLGRYRWGLLDEAVDDAHGASIHVGDAAQSRSAAQVVVDCWHCVTWHPDQPAASAAYDAARARTRQGRE